jgi:hypothetical protein
MVAALVLGEAAFSGIGCERWLQPRKRTGTTSKNSVDVFITMGRLYVERNSMKPETF